jgi:hypothetical protein
VNACKSTSELFNRLKESPMKRIVPALAMFAMAAAAAAADVGVSVTVNQPGLYGRIDIGNLPPPQVIFAQPMLVQPVVPGVPAPEPIYLHVPPGHEKHWRKHCAKYHACDRPVYFVHEDWYRDVYVPRHRDERREEGRRGEGRRDEGRHEGRRDGEGDRGEGRGRGRHDD